MPRGYPQRPKPTPEQTAARFWSKVEKGQGCWTWTAGRNADGYGWFKISGGPKVAHRVAWELTNGPIPEGLIVRHRCDNPPCVNPGHLELGTHKDNRRDCSQRGRASSRFTGVTHCIYGHEFTPENTRLRKGGRECRECIRRRDLARRGTRSRRRSTSAVTPFTRVRELVPGAVVTALVGEATAHHND
jgi:hypothetical protein